MPSTIITIPAAGAVFLPADSCAVAVKLSFRARADLHEIESELAGFLDMLTEDAAQNPHLIIGVPVLSQPEITVEPGNVFTADLWLKVETTDPMGAGEWLRDNGVLDADDVTLLDFRIDWSVTQASQSKGIAAARNLAVAQANQAAEEYAGLLYPTGVSLRMTEVEERRVAVEDRRSYSHAGRQKVLDRFFARLAQDGGVDVEVGVAGTYLAEGSISAA